ncbi:hypothetical protein ACFQGX_47165 [Nonomuraea dietziae]
MAASLPDWDQHAETDGGLVVLLGGSTVAEQTLTASRQQHGGRHQGGDLR